MSAVSRQNITSIPTESLFSWQEELQRVVTEPAELLEMLALPATLLPAAEQSAKQFELRVPRPFIQKMQSGNARDPLLLQVLPLADETRSVVGYVSDPLQEQQSNPLKGLIHKYQSRVLLTLAPACAVNCRYCFRRHFPYQDNSPSRAEWRQVLDYIGSDKSITEVILSGGDPLLAPDRQLAWLVAQLETIENVQRLRIHTRLPVVIPQRIDDALLGWIGATKLQKVMVLHVNHPAEIDAVLSQKVMELKARGVTVLNQAVLLKGINDNVETLVALSEALFSAGILPYYLHLLDKTAGTAHFDCSEARALELFYGIQQRLSGFLVPRLVREVPERSSKTLIF